MKDIKQKHSFSLLGGDKRQYVLADELIRRGHCVRLFGLGEESARLTGAEICTGIEKAIEGSRFLLLPLPMTRDNANLSLVSEPSVGKIELAELVRLSVKHGCKGILGGMIPQEFIRLCESNRLFVRDYYQSETLQRKNALPSAEGALMIAMEHTDRTVYGMKALVGGYGRIGKILASLLQKLGAEVIVAARREETLCEIAMDGYHAIRLGDEYDALQKAVDKADVIFNTIPFVIFTERVLSGTKNKPLYVEIASNPGGIDLSCARRMGIKTVFAPSLPGKYAPASAGEYIFETIADILSERRIHL